MSRREPVQELRDRAVAAVKAVSPWRKRRGDEQPVRSGASSGHDSSVAEKLSGCSAGVYRRSKQLVV